MTLSDKIWLSMDDRIETAKEDDIDVLWVKDVREALKNVVEKINKDCIINHNGKRTSDTLVILDILKEEFGEELMKNDTKR